jgi:hypothetical protein
MIELSFLGGTPTVACNNYPNKKIDSPLMRDIKRYIYNFMYVYMESGGELFFIVAYGALFTANFFSETPLATVTLFLPHFFDYFSYLFKKTNHTRARGKTVFERIK